MAARRHIDAPEADLPALLADVQATFGKACLPLNLPDAAAQIGLACESLKTTTRLMHVIAWLLHRRAMIAGDPGAGPNDSAARIGEPVAADWDVCAGFEASVRRIIAASERLFERIAAIEAGVVYAPVLGEMFTAVKGGGAFMNGAIRGSPSRQVDCSGLASPCNP